MGLLSDFFSFLTDLPDDSYIVDSERWFDNVYKKFKRLRFAEGRLEIRDGKLYRKFSVLFYDGTSLIITDDRDEGGELRSAYLNTDQKKQLLRDGYITIKEYEQ